MADRPTPTPAPQAPEQRREEPQEKIRASQAAVSETLLRKFEAMEREIADLKKERELPVPQRQPGERIGKDVIRRFLAEEVSPALFFRPSGTNLSIQVFPDLPTSVNPLTGVATRRQALVVKFDRWPGPGSELDSPQKDDTFFHRAADPKWAIGFCDLSRCESVNVSRKDIDTFRLLPEGTPEEAIQLRLNDRGDYSLEEAIKAMLAQEEYLRGEFLSGKEFQVLLRGRYAVIAAEEDAKTQREELFQGLRKDSWKANQNLSVGV